MFFGFWHFSYIDFGVELLDCEPLARVLRGLAPPQFGLIEVCTLSGSQIGFSGAVQKSHVQQRCRCTASAKLSDFSKAVALRSQTATAVTEATFKVRRYDFVFHFIPQESRLGSQSEVWSSK